MGADIIVGGFCIFFGMAHVLWAEQLYDYYLRHPVFRFVTGSTLGAMKVHGMILAVLGGGLVIRGTIT